jgi:hypothetical protein
VSTRKERAVSDKERDQQDEAAEDAKEDLEIKDEDADEVRGGAIYKSPGDSPDALPYK